MKILRCSLPTVVAISFFTVLGAARPSQAGPITYSFSGVLADCATPPLGCVNDLSGHTVAGTFTVDSAISTLLAASFSVLGPSNFIWRIVFPDQVSNSTTFTVSPTSLFIHESILPPNAEDFVLDLNFNSPLTASAGSTLQNGFIIKGSVPIQNPFVSGRVDLVPEPSSMLLLGTGLIGLFSRFRTLTADESVRNIGGQLA